MRSKQINFFITPEDVPEIDIFLKEKGCVFIRNNAPSPRMAFEYDIVNNKEQVFQVYLTKEEFRNKVMFKFIDSKNYYYVYDTKSDVIEFSIGGFYPYSSRELHRGRFYYVFGYYDNEENVVQKDFKFINWADDLFKDFKKQFLKKAPEFTSDFISDRAIEWAKRNHAKPMEGGQKLVIS